MNDSAQASKKSELPSGCTALRNCVQYSSSTRRAGRARERAAPVHARECAPRAYLARPRLGQGLRRAERRARAHRLGLQSCAAPPRRARGSTSRRSSGCAARSRRCCPPLASSTPGRRTCACAGPRAGPRRVRPPGDNDRRRRRAPGSGSRPERRLSVSDCPHCRGFSRWLPQCAVVSMAPWRPSEPCLGSWPCARAPHAAASAAAAPHAPGPRSRSSSPVRTRANGCFGCFSKPERGPHCLSRSATPASE